MILIYLAKDIKTESSLHIIEKCCRYSSVFRWYQMECAGIIEGIEIMHRIYKKVDILPHILISATDDDKYKYYTEHHSLEYGTVTIGDKRLLPPCRN